MTASDVLVYTTLAVARQEGMPEPLKTTVLSRLDEPMLVLHLASADDVAKWQDWLQSRRAEPQWRTRDEVSDGWFRHRTTGEWCGWLVDLLHTQQTGLEAGVAGD